VILIGTRGAVTQGYPTGAAMPAFSWKLTDEQIAAVTTYIRNAWGNAASAVSVSDAPGARDSLKARTAFSKSQ
jgi:mono/diheme cytochrome c family protein